MFNQNFLGKNLPKIRQKYENCIFRPIIGKNIILKYVKKLGKNQPNFQQKILKFWIFRETNEG